MGFIEQEVIVFLSFHLTILKRTGQGVVLQPEETEVTKLQDLYPPPSHSQCVLFFSLLLLSLLILSPHFPCPISRNLFFSSLFLAWLTLLRQ